VEEHVLKLIRQAIFLLLPLALLTLPLAPARAADPYDINVILSLTGIAAFIGTEEATALRALETVENRRGGINGRPIHFDIADDSSNAATAVQLANQIVGKGVPVILGPTLTASCEAVFAIVRNNGPVEYCFSPALHAPAGSYGFSGGASTADISLGGMRYFRERGLKRIALISSTDASGQDGENVVLANMKLAENAGLTIVADEHFATGDVSVAAQIARMKAANPQAVIAWTTGTPTATVLHGMHDAGLDVPTLLNAGNIVAAQLKQYASFVPAELLLPGLRFLARDPGAPKPMRDAQKAFYDALGEMGKSPEVNDSFAWDSARVVLEALRHLGPQPTAVQVRDYLEQLHGFAGVNAVMDYRDGNQRGVPISAIVVLRWDPVKTAFVPVSKPGGFPL
jgi:branched-chain amino acid transport system substrate-binding protein